MYDATYPKFRAGSLALAAFLTLPLLLGCQSANRNQKLYGSAAYWQTAQGRAGLNNQPPVQSQSPIYQRGSMYPTAGYGGAGYGNMGYGGAGYGQFNRNAMGPGSTARIMFNSSDPCAALRQSSNGFAVSGGTLEIVELRKKCSEQSGGGGAAPISERPEREEVEKRTGVRQDGNPWETECKEALGHEPDMSQDSDQDGIVDECETALMKRYPALNPTQFNGFRVSFGQLEAGEVEKGFGPWFARTVSGTKPLNVRVAEAILRKMNEQKANKTANPSDAPAIKSILDNSIPQALDDTLVTNSGDPDHVTVIKAGYGQPVGYDPNQMNAAFSYASMSGVFTSLNALREGDSFIYLAEASVYFTKSTPIRISGLTGTWNVRPDAGVFLVLVDGQTKLNSLGLTNAGSAGAALNRLPEQMQYRVPNGWHLLTVVLVAQATSRSQIRSLIQENVVMQYPDGKFGRLMQEVALPTDPIANVAGFRENTKARFEKYRVLPEPEIPSNGGTVAAEEQPAAPDAAAEPPAAPAKGE